MSDQPMKVNVSGFMLRDRREPLMTETVIVSQDERFVLVPRGMWHTWQRDMKALLSKEAGE